MLEAAFVVARTTQYAAAVILFGSPLFFLYGLPVRGSAAAARLAWPRPLFALAGAALLAGAVVTLAAQTANMTGAPADAFRPQAWLRVITGADFGPAMAGRVLLGLAALVLAWLGCPSVLLWAVVSLVGGAALASFAWTGHGASDEGVAGLVHLGADVVHLLAAGVWLGALAVLAILLFTSKGRSDPAALGALHRGLEGFSGVGTSSVAALLATGLLNGWFLVGPGRVGDLLAAPYGRLLCAKIILFVAMLALAGLNRFGLTPALGRSLARGDAAVESLRVSIAFETAFAVAILALVGVLGTLAPPSAMG